MWWRITRREFESNGNAGNRAAFRAIVERGEATGLLGYRDGIPIAWVAVAPRDRFGSLNRSRVLRRIDDRPVWSLVCLYIHPSHRGRGLSEAMIRAATDWVAGQGGRIVEAYPTRPRAGRLAPVSVYMGLPAVYERAGFTVCAEPSASKLVMRYEIPGDER